VRNIELINPPMITHAMPTVLSPAMAEESGGKRSCWSLRKRIRTACQTFEYRFTRILILTQRAQSLLTQRAQSVSQRAQRRELAFFAKFLSVLCVKKLSIETEVMLSTPSSDESAFVRREPMREKFIL
jgi:hypothetical protein